MVTTSPNATAYRAFTLAFDRVVHSTQLDTVLGSLPPGQEKELNAAWDMFQHGLTAWKMRIHLKAIETSERIRTRMTDHDRSETVVALLVDQSGSMRGQSMLFAAAAADIAQDFLGHLGCKVEVLGFTTVSWLGGRSRRRWKWLLRPNNPGRLCDLLHIIYRSADDPRVSTGSWSYRNMLRPDLPKENIDGEAILWAAHRLAARPERRKMIVVISDGAPVDDSTLDANGPTILDTHLREVIADITAQGDVELFALGIGFDVARYYAVSSTIKIVEDLGAELVGLLETALLTSSNRTENPAKKT